MTDYILEHPNGCVIATYTKGGKLKKAIAKRGVIRDGMLKLIPCEEREVDKSILKPYSPIKDDFFTKAQKAWLEFYSNRTHLQYRFTTVDGAALKSIGKHLISISGGSMEALEAWKFILLHWDQLDAFYRNNADLKFINSQLNKILNLLKNGKQTGTANQSHTADDLRRGF